MFAQLRRYPVTLLGTMAALLVFFVPGASELFQLDFAAVAGGEFWRVVTGHWTHFDSSHLFWDVLMFAGLSAACEANAGKWYAGLLVVMGLVVSSGVAVCCPEISVYRGLSGLDTGLFCWLVADRIVRAARERELAVLAGGAILALALLAKLGFEWKTGETLFVAAGDFQPLVQSHLFGAALGLLYGFGGLLKSVVRKYRRPLLKFALIGCNRWRRIHTQAKHQPFGGVKYVG